MPVFTRTITIDAVLVLLRIAVPLAFIGKKKDTELLVLHAHPFPVKVMVMVAGSSMMELFWGWGVKEKRMKTEEAAANGGKTSIKGSRTPIVDDTTPSSVPRVPEAMTPPATSSIAD